MNYLSGVEIKKIIRDNKMLDKKYVRKAMNTLSGEQLTRDKARKSLSSFIQKWSKVKNTITKESMIREAGIRREKRADFKQSLGGAVKKSSSEIRKEKDRQLKKIKRNIFESTKSLGSDNNGDYKELVGQRVGSEGKVRRSFYSTPEKNRSHLAMSANLSAHASTNSGIERPSLGNRNSSQSLSVNNKANAITGGVGINKGTSLGTGGSGLVRPMGMSGLK